MKNTVIFVLSFTSNIRRGRQTLAPQEAGVFRLYGKQAICTRRARSVMGRATRAERLVFDSGRGKSLFVCPKNVKHHHASRNPPAQHAAHPTHTIRTPFANPCPNGQATCKHGSQAFGLARQDASGLPVASAAIPPAAFLHNYFLNRLAL